MATTAPTASHVTGSLYVGDLHPDVTETQLFEIFKDVGPVISIRVCRDNITRRSLGYAYVNYQNLSDAERALDLLNYRDIKGRPIRIMWSQRDPSLRKAATSNIFIKNLDKSIDNKLLYDTFATYGNILSCKIATDSHSNSKGYGFIHYETEEAANLAIQKVNGKLIQGKQVFVGKFIPSKVRVKGDAEPKWTNIFVKNISKSVTDEKFKDLFTPFGEITSAVLVTDEQGKSKGFGFVNYTAHEQASKAVEEMNGKQIDDEQLYVGKAQKKSEREKELKAMFEKLKRERMSKYQGVNLFIKNLDDSIDDAQLREEFQHCGTITSAKVMKDEKTGLSKGFGFVCFSGPEEATKAVTEMNGKMIVNKPIYVALAQRRDQRRAQLEALYAQKATVRMGPQVGGPGMPPGPGLFPGAPAMYFAPPQPGQRPGFMYPAQMMPRGRFPGPQQGRPGYPPVPFVVPGPQGPPRGGPRMKGQPQQGQAYPGFKYNANVRNQQVAVPPEATGTAPAATPAQPMDQQTIGENLYPLIATALEPLKQEGLTGKITGMLLESMEVSELIHLLDSQDALNKKIVEALEVLEQHNTVKA